MATASARLEEATNLCLPRHIGRIYFVSPTVRNSELYYLRLLLTTKRGAGSLEDMRTVDDVIHPTFLAAAQALGLCDDDAEWDHCLRDAVSFKNAPSLRELFVTIIAFNRPTDAGALWLKYRNDMADDFSHQRKRLILNFALLHSDSD